MNLRTQLQKIQNYTLEECIVIFGTSRIVLSHHVLLLTGKINGTTHLGFIRILNKCEDGQYVVGVYHHQDMFHMIPMKVASLTSIREEIFHFEDQLSFERATFIIVKNSTLVRYKCVRSLLCMPWQAKLENSRLTLRTQLQCKKSLQQIFTSYVRDLSPHSKYNILELLKNDICSYLLALHELIV